MSQIRVVITDLDNTLYNWVDFYIPSFLAMVKEIHRKSGISEEEIKAAFKRLHEKHKTTEYSLAIQQLDIIRRLHSELTEGEILDHYRSAVDAFQEMREKTLRLYPGVKETLSLLKKKDKLLVAQSDSMFYYSFKRLRQLGIEELFDAICAPKDHVFPPKIKPYDVRQHSDSAVYETIIPLKIELPDEIRKPNTQILRKILRSMGVTKHEALFVGDSLTRDILMACKCGVRSVLAKYGQCSSENYRELLNITYWTDKDVGKDTELRESKIEPDFTIDRFPELAEVVAYVEKGSKYTLTPQSVNV